MAQRIEHRSIDDAVELLKEHGFEGLAEAVTVLLNTAIGLTSNQGITEITEEELLNQVMTRKVKPNQKNARLQKALVS